MQLFPLRKRIPAVKDLLFEYLSNLHPVGITFLPAAYHSDYVYCFIHKHMINCSAAYLFKEKIFLHSESQTIHGLWILSEPIIKVEKDDLEALGQSIQSVITGSKPGVAHPTSWKGVFDPMLKVAGVKTYSAFAKGAKCVDLEYDGTTLKMIPTINLGSKDGFEQLNDKMQPVPFNDKTELAHTLIRSFDLCE